MTIAHFPGHPLPYDRYLEAIERETARFAAAITAEDPTAAVPTCPDWTLADLTGHLGTVQRWFSVLLTRVVQEPPRERTVELGLPEREDALAEWLSTGVSEVLALLRTTDPDAPMWAWGADQRARFWVRRMAFETLVHRVDAERTVGRTSDIDATLAADGVDEFLVNLPYAGSFAPDVANLRGNGEAIRFECTDRESDGDTWVVRLRPDTFGIEPERAEEAPSGQTLEHAKVRGRAADLLLLMYGRLTYDSRAFEVSGDERLLTRWFSHSAF
ncbi:maleylpyruvate isomerase family mycothiol-dependent enzyme [Streptomyces sp. NPDC005407]|uniref:maleylpyruvate isomerase family mycothiol-dependent enzyme n=1 Tax=Streptomyces sp. NPDC005407 TaxID=3155340 RepID=UPI0033B3BA6D